jgi:hypothetical protein
MKIKCKKTLKLQKVLKILKISSWKKNKTTKNLMKKFKIKIE